VDDLTARVLAMVDRCPHGIGGCVTCIAAFAAEVRVDAVADAFRTNATLWAERDGLQRERDAFQECALKRAAWQEEAQRAVDDLKTENESLGRIIGEQQAEVERLRAALRLYVPDSPPSQP